MLFLSLMTRALSRLISYGMRHRNRGQVPEMIEYPRDVTVKVGVGGIPLTFGYALHLNHPGHGQQLLDAGEQLDVIGMG